MFIRKKLSIEIFLFDFFFNQFLVSLKTNLIYKTYTRSQYFVSKSQSTELAKTGVQKYSDLSYENKDVLNDIF